MDAVGHSASVCKLNSQYIGIYLGVDDFLEESDYMKKYPYSSKTSNKKKVEPKENSSFTADYISLGGKLINDDQNFNQSKKRKIEESTETFEDEKYWEGETTAKDISRSATVKELKEAIDSLKEENARWKNICDQLKSNK